MSTKTRLNKIEQAHSTGVKKKYLCCITNGMFGDVSKDYTVQPYTVSQGGTGGDNIHFETRAELDKFAARLDVDLYIVNFVCDSAIEAD